MKFGNIYCLIIISIMTIGCESNPVADTQLDANMDQVSDTNVDETTCIVHSVYRLCNDMGSVKKAMGECDRLSAEIRSIFYDELSLNGEDKPLSDDMEQFCHEACSDGMNEVSEFDTPSECT